MVVEMVQKWLFRMYGYVASSYIKMIFVVSIVTARREIIFVYAFSIPVPSCATYNEGEIE